MNEKIQRLISLYDQYIDMLQEDIIIYESMHGNDPGHEDVYNGEGAIIEELAELCDFFERGDDVN